MLAFIAFVGLPPWRRTPCTMLAANNLVSFCIVHETSAELLCFSGARHKRAMVIVTSGIDLYSGVHLYITLPL